MVLNLPHETRSYKLTGITRILGSQPANPDVRSRFVADKIAVMKADEENKHLPEYDEDQLKGMNLTVFLRDNGRPCICDYIIKGYLKEALGVIKNYDGVNLAGGSTKIDNLVFVAPTYITFNRNGEPVMEPEKPFERSLRAMTMQGPRTTVTASEVIGEGWEIEFEITLMANKATAKSSALTFDIIEKAFEYGKIKGLGQWRNAANGRFNWERIK